MMIRLLILAMALLAASRAAISMGRSSKLQQPVPEMIEVLELGLEYLIGELYGYEERTKTNKFGRSRVVAGLLLPSKVSE
jgi:hypothetical protein